MNASQAQPPAPAAVRSRLIRATVPMTKMLNPALVKLAGRRHIWFAQIHHTGRRSGRPYVTPASARQDGDTFVIPLTYGNQSDWSRDVRAAGGCSIRIHGVDNQVVRPQLADKQQVLQVFSLLRGVGGGDGGDQRDVWVMAGFLDGREVAVFPGSEQHRHVATRLQAAQVRQGRATRAVRGALSVHGCLWSWGRLIVASGPGAPRRRRRRPSR
jgi:deazaflavin-dependent oxidoreductase (nitroreductase family)